MQLDLRSVVVGYGVAQMSAELADPRAGIRGRSEVRFRRQTGRHLLVLFMGFWLTGLQKKSASPTRRKGAIITGE